MRSFSCAGGGALAAGGGAAFEGVVVETTEGLRFGIGFFSEDFWPGRMGVTAKICSACFSGVEPSLFYVSIEILLLMMLSSHVCIQDPVQIFFAFVWASWTASDRPEQSW